MIVWMTALAMAGKWDGMNADVVAEVTVNAPTEVVRAQFEDLHTLDLYSDECISELMIGEPSAHLGAPFRVRYHAGPWSRMVEGRISEVGHQYVDWDHSGKYGFATRYQFSSQNEGAGTVVTMTTFLDPPPWPFKGVFYRRVRPGWAACHHELLRAVAQKLDGRGVVPPEDQIEAETLPPVEDDPAVQESEL